ncbi:MAG: DUF2791 family P-loop domain-containing protein, partial [Actinomycetota bacterium]|nr:DUF2791 family P-loop domain-containing protein [Actinomycetota bacterium]
MLNIGKLRGDAADYYLANLATSVEEYYTGKGEAPGRWLGRGAEALQLSGVVDPPVLRRVLNGRHSDSGEALLPHPRRVPGFDLAFRPPKSVSLLWALADPGTSLEVRRAHDVAVDAAIDYLERHAAHTRRGRGGHEQVRVSGFIAAAFRHRTSRAEDPLLHTHVLVANLAHTANDGKWRTLDARQLYLHAKTAGYLYQSHLRAELTRRLGVEWGPVVNGCADLAGVPRHVIDAFSRRRSDIVISLGERGYSSAKAAQVAALATRRAKEPLDDGIHRRWRERAIALGFDAKQVGRLTGRAAATTPDPAWIEGVLRRLLGASGLTSKASTFTRRDGLQAWCQNLRAGAELARVEELTDRLLGSTHGVVALNGPEGPVRRLTRGDVIRLVDGRPIPSASSEVRYTTLELLAIEQRLISDALGRLDARVGVVPEHLVENAVARRVTLTEEQAAAVRQLTRSGAAVEVVVGKAGSGKTYMLAGAREAWETAGFHVIGCALAARAAVELETGSGIPSTTIERLLADLQHDRARLTSASVVVIDEAAMVGTRTLSQLHETASAAGAKTVLVGDHHQLPEIDSGGAFAGLVNRLPAIELTVNRRQQHEWERDALDQLRAGDVARAVDTYAHHDRILAAKTPDAAQEQLVGDWWQAVAQHGHDAVMVAGNRADVSDLNAWARQRMVAAGKLSGA